jgi:hypothetical protein
MAACAGPTKGWNLMDGDDARVQDCAAGQDAVPNRMWAESDLRSALWSAEDAARIAVDLIHLAKRQITDQDESDDGYVTFLKHGTALLGASQRARDAIRPLASELIRARKVMSRPAPTYCGYADAFALGSATTFAYGVLQDGFAIPIANGSQFVMPGVELTEDLKSKLSARRGELARFDPPTIAGIKRDLDTEIGIAIQIRAERNIGSPEKGGIWKEETSEVAEPSLDEIRAVSRAAQDIAHYAGALFEWAGAQSGSTADPHFLIDAICQAYSGHRWQPSDIVALTLATEAASIKPMAGIHAKSHHDLAWRIGEFILREAGEAIGAHTLVGWSPELGVSFVRLPPIEQVPDWNNTMRNRLCGAKSYDAAELVAALERELARALRGDHISEAGGDRKGLVPADAATPHGMADTSDPGREVAEPAAKAGFLGGSELADALGVHPSRRDAFFKRLERKRLELGDDCWDQVRDRRPNAPEYLYRADSPNVRELAAAYKNPKPV